MTAIVNTVEIARRPEDVFAYLDDVERHREWQTQIVSTHRATDGPTRVGTRVDEVRHVGGRDQKMSYEVTEHDPPRAFGFRVIEGPVRAFGRGVVEPIGDGSRSRMTLSMDFEGHGMMGKLIVPLARAQARKQVVADGERMKAQLEAGGGSGEAIRADEGAGPVAAEGGGSGEASPTEGASPVAGDGGGSGEASPGHADEASSIAAEGGGAEGDPPAPTV